MSTSDTDRQGCGANDAISAVRGLRKERTGRVISVRMKRTCIVETINLTPHQRFGKIVKHRKRYYVHDETDCARVGDTVRICETRRISKMKCWRLVEVMETAS